MRQLRFVRLDCESDDAVHLHLESADGSEQFSLPVDEAVRLAVRIEPDSRSDDGPSARHLSAWVPAAPPVVQPVAEPESARPVVQEVKPEVHIAPREVQVRVRAGESPQAVADSLGVGVERVLRFAQPVMDERRRVAGEARRARARRPEGAENSVVVFGEAVDERFTAHGITAAEVVWDAHRREDGDWVVAAEWLGGQGRHCAEWVFHRTSRSVMPVDDTASELLSDRPIRPLVAPEPEPVRPSLASAPALAPGVVAFPPMADANTGPLPQLDEVFDQNAASEGPRDVPPFVPATVPAGAAAPAAEATPEPVAEEPQLEFEALPLPLGITDPSARPDAAGPRSLASLTNINRPKRDEPEAERAARARIPSWDDILLGVRRKQD